MIWSDGTQDKSRSLFTTHWCLFWLLMVRESQKQKTLCKVIYFHSSLSEQLGATPPTVRQMRESPFWRQCSWWLQEMARSPSMPLTEWLSCAGLGDHLFPLPCTSLSYPSREVLKNLVCVTSAAAAPRNPCLLLCLECGPSILLLSLYYSIPCVPM